MPDIAESFERLFFFEQSAHNFDITSALQKLLLKHGDIPGPFVALAAYYCDFWTFSIHIAILPFTTLSMSTGTIALMFVVALMSLFCCDSHQLIVY